MGWTYSGDPTTSTRDQVRFELGDTDINDQQLMDAEIDYLVTTHSDPWYAAASGCEAISRKYSRQAQKTVGTISIAAQQRADAYHKRATELREQAIRIGGLPGIGIGGQSIAEKINEGSNPDQVQPQFQIGMDDTTGTASMPGMNPLLGRV